MRVKSDGWLVRFGPWLALGLLISLIVIVIGFSWFVATNFAQADIDTQAKPDVYVALLEQYVGTFEIVVVGVLVALVSILLPLVFSHAKDRFDRYKEARLAYSSAKTAVLYLPDLVLRAETEMLNPERDVGFELIENAHRQLHLAETFELEIIDRGFLDWYTDKTAWMSHNYWRIAAVAAALRWYEKEGAEVEHLRTKLEATLSAADKAFGEHGENWKNYQEEAFEDHKDSWKKYQEKMGREVRDEMRDDNMKLIAQEQLASEIEQEAGLPCSTLGLRDRHYCAKKREWLTQMDN